MPFADPFETVRQPGKIVGSGFQLRHRPGRMVNENGQNLPAQRLVSHRLSGKMLKVQPAFLIIHAHFSLPEWPIGRIRQNFKYGYRVLTIFARFDSKRHKYFNSTTTPSMPFRKLFFTR